MRDPPSGTVTFLFTDIEGSTRLWEEQPDLMRVALAEHDDALRAAIDENDGYVFSTGGDGFAAAFRRAADAVAAAEQAQTALADHPHIRVRMGINTGEVHERDGDFFGPPVNRTARLMAAGHGGQVLIAAVTAELVTGLVLRNLGVHRLRDLGSPMLIWQLGTQQFPPLRTLDHLPGNLPVQRTSFVGRVDELQQLSALVSSERLVTLIGPGGVGKSRLALQVAADTATTFADGVWHASLAALEEGSLVAGAILEALGVAERRGESMLDTLCAWAKNHDALVVLDNCEHLLADVGHVVDCVLSTPTTTTVLATSQAPLGVSGEHVWSVPALSVADGSNDSVDLFVDRGRMARADFALTADNETTIREICERLDHMPLAIELAAARVRGMAPSEIAQRLDQRFRLLTSGDRLAPGRHRTLDAAVRWSYELLDETQQRVFDRLSVFAGTFTIDAAEAVVAGDGVDEWDVLDGVLALVDKSLVVTVDTTSGTRYRLLETMRQFGQSNLASSGEAMKYRVGHADHFIDFVLSRRAQIQGAEDVAGHVAVEAELENIRIALRHAADDHESSRFELLYSTLFSLWIGRGRGAEGAAWALELERRPDRDPGTRIRALGFAAAVVQPTSLSSALRLAAAAERLSAETGAAPPLMAVAVTSLGAMMQGTPDLALAQCDRIVALAPSEPAAFIRCAAYSSAIAVLGICGATSRVAEVRRHVDPLVEQIGNSYLRAGYASSIAAAAFHGNAADLAETLLHAFRLNDEMSNRYPNSSIAMFLSLHRLRADDVVGAAGWAETALQLAIDHGPTFIPMVIDPIVAITRRHSPTAASTLLGALRADRERRHQVGSESESTAEHHYEIMLRHDVGDRFDAHYEAGSMLDEDHMITFALQQLREITQRAPNGLA